MGVVYLHSRGVCHGGIFIQPSIHRFVPTTLTPCTDLHTRNFLLSGPNLDSLSPDEIHKRYRLDKAPITRFDGAAVEPRAPPYAVYSMHIKMSAEQLIDPIVRISDYGTSFVLAAGPSPQLHTPALYLSPPKASSTNPSH